MARLKKLKFNNTSYEFPVEDVKVGTTSVVTDGVATIDLSGKANTSDVLTKTNTTAFTPSGDYNPATKKYVDDNKTEYNAGKGIEIGTGQDYSAMRGPCDEGFHIPTSTERSNLWDTWGTISNQKRVASAISTNLKLPFSGQREYNNSDTSGQGIRGEYRCCDHYNNAAHAYRFGFNTGNTIGVSSYFITDAYTIRAFKDIPVIPDNSWTTIYDGSSTATGAGVFHNASLGLISVSSDGTTWYTIQDKNVGATTVYNYGDTLSEANCGKYFQRGNNYGFPRTGTLSNTSTSQVDATNYGPGNYYSSNTFIIISSSPYQWDSSANRNLRGGVTGVVTIQNVIINTGVLSVNGQTGNVSNVVTGDGQYVINVSTTAPASGTASNVITIVTD